MIDNFQTARWSDTRNAIHAMKRGQVLTFPADQYFNCHATTQRLNDAYSGVRRWVMTCTGRKCAEGKRVGGESTIRRAK